MIKISLLVLCGLLCCKGGEEEPSKVPNVNALCQTVLMKENTMGSVENGTCVFSCFQVENDRLVKILEDDYIPDGVACKMDNGEIGKCLSGNCEDSTPKENPSRCCRNCSEDSDEDDDDQSEDSKTESDEDSEEENVTPEAVK